MARSFSGRHSAVGSEGVQLFGLVAFDPAAPRFDGVEVVTVRNLSALVTRVKFARLDPSSTAIQQFRDVVEGAFRVRPVLPAPFGTVFRSRDSLTRWMEVHYVALVDALGYVSDRAAIRVRLIPEATLPTNDAERLAFDSLRFLRRNAVACVTHDGAPADERAVVDASFLVAKDQVTAFADAVADEQSRLGQITIEQSGPWPAYDFVRLQFGA